MIKHARWGKLIPYICLSAVFFALVIPLILKPEIDIYDARDETSFHYKTVKGFIDQFPHLDLVNYRSATTPLYHFVMTLSSFVVGPELIRLRVVNAFLSLACLLTIFMYLFRRGRILKASYFTVLFLSSPYFIGPAIRLSTDNPALLLAVLSLFVLDRVEVSRRNSLAAAILVLLTILTRQVYAWLIGAYFFVCLRDYQGNRFVWASFVKALFACIPVLGFLPFLLLWNGLTPPEFAKHTAVHLNWDAPVYIVALLGFFGSFFLFWFLKLFREMPRKALVVMSLLLVAAACLMVHPVSNIYDRSMRGGPLWLLASHLPTVFSCSIVFWGLFPLGLAFLYLMTRYLWARGDRVVVVGYFLWLLFSLINIRTYQKYYEPFTIFYMGYALMPIKVEKSYHWILPSVLLLGLMGIGFQRFF